MKIAIVGYGRMGRQIEAVALERGHRVVLTVDEANKDDLYNGTVAQADVAIEFSQPEAAYGNICACLQAGVRVVSGTTGWTEQYDRVVAMVAELNGAFFYASNFSLGVNVFFEANRRLAAMMGAIPGADVTITEVHHTGKKDAPSGTAITLAEGILDGFLEKKRWASGYTTAPEELGISAVRRGGVEGIHTVEWEGPTDAIKLMHVAKGRRGFAEGAVLAAEYLQGKHGTFSMRDLLKF